MFGLASFPMCEAGGLGKAAWIEGFSLDPLQKCAVGVLGPAPEPLRTAEITCRRREDAFVSSRPVCLS